MRLFTVQRVSLRAIGLLLASALAVCAGPVTIDFANAPTGWTVDRYAPASFSNIGTYMGVPNVIGLGISSGQGLNNRPNGFNVQFFNTQGEAYSTSGGPGSWAEAMLYIPLSWSDPGNGSRRSDLWTVMPLDGQPPQNWEDGIIGFTNYGGAARFRVWDNQVGWVDLSNTVNYDQWTTFRILFTGSALQYFVNGSLVYTDNEAGLTQISSVILHAYNFYDPSMTDAVATDYTAYWAATAVPEPASFGLVFGGAVALIGWRRINRRSAR